jgi:hypothetical protein
MNQPYTKSSRRPLQIFAFDPMIARTERRELTLEIENEPLRRGPLGSRIEVIDYDGISGSLYEPVNLDDPAVLMNDGLSPTESDPRFHQQMVYAVAMKTLENFEICLGRKLRFIDGKPLRMYPHAFAGANAFYDPASVSILFGYFQADAEDPGPNLPDQIVFSCLSHDIIAHETTHAIVHRLRRHFSDASNRDVLAFHEGFADIVAIFQHFSFRDVLADTIQKNRGDLRSPAALIDLAEQFGYASGGGRALRSARDPDEKNKPDPKLYDSLIEPHDRGSLLVESVFDAFFAIYQNRIDDLVRIATGGSGVLPPGALHPDLVSRIGREASKTAQNVLTMCIRAFEYLPPVDVTFGDFLRAIVTADYAAVPEDGRGLRAAMVEAFRARGIYPDGVTSLAEDSLLWRTVEGLRLPFEPYLERLAENAKAYDRTAAVPASGNEGLKKWAVKLSGWAKENAAALSLDTRHKIDLLGFHTVFRVSPDGQLAIELVAQFDQVDDATKNDPEYGGVPFRGGVTVIAGANGGVKYIIPKPMSSERRERQKAYVTELDETDFALTWSDGKGEHQRMKARTSFAALHRGLR